MAPVAEPLLGEHRRHGRTLVAGLLGVAGAVAVSGGLLYAFAWPAVWWTDPAALTRIALAFIVLALAWRRFDSRGAPMAARSAGIEDQLTRHVLPAAFAALRPGAVHTPSGAIDRGWIRRSALVDGVRDYRCDHLVTWQAGGHRRQIAQVEATRETTNRDGDTTRHVVFKGLVAIADLPVAIPGHVRVWAADLHHERPGEVSGLPAVDRRALGEARPGLPPTVLLDEVYEVGASAPDVARRVITADVVELLHAAHAAGHRVRVAVAHREVVVAFDLRRQWFRAIASGFGEERFVAMGEMLDVVDAMAATVSRAGEPPA